VLTIKAEKLVWVKGSNVTVVTHTRNVSLGYLYVPSSSIFVDPIARD